MDAPVELPAGLEHFDDETVAQSLLRSYLELLSDLDVELSVHLHLTHVHKAPRATAEALARATADNQRAFEARKRGRILKRAPSEIWTAKLTATEAVETFVPLAYWSISAQVYVEGWPWLATFDSQDAGLAATYAMDLDTYRRLIETVDNASLPSSWPTAL